MSLQNPPIYHYTEEEINGLRAVFNKIDTDRNSYLNQSEMIQFLQQCNMDTRFIKAVFYVFDSNKDGLLSFDEYIRYLNACKQTEKDSRYLFRLIFNAVDANKDNKLSVDELCVFVDLCGSPMTKDKVEIELHKIDLNRNSFVEFPELCRAFGI